MVEDSWKQKYRLTRDVVIPSGTEVHMGERPSPRPAPIGMACVDLDNGSTADLTFDLDHAVRNNIIEPIDSE